MLEITVKNKVGMIEFNNEDLKKELEIELKKYDVVVTEDSIKEAKVLKAKLNKVKSLIDDERKRIKKEYCVPLVEFESKVKELTTMLEGGYNKINKQVAEFELEEIRIKKESVREKYSFIELPIDIDFEKLWESNYENKGMTEKKIIDEFQVKVDKIVQDLDFVETFTSEFSDVEKLQVKEVYKKTLDIGMAKNEVDKLILLKEKVKEESQLEIFEDISPVIDDIDHAHEMEVERDTANELLTRTFQVQATKEQIIDLGNYMNKNNINFRKVEQ